TTWFVHLLVRTLNLLARVKEVAGRCFGFYVGAMSKLCECRDASHDHGAGQCQRAAASDEDRLCPQCRASENQNQPSRRSSLSKAEVNQRRHHTAEALVLVRRLPFHKRRLEI